MTHLLKKKEETMGLVAVEMIEMLVPIAYIITFTIAFYGKNAELIGGVKFGGWQHKEVDDLISFSSDLMMMFAIDFTALIVSAILLWRYASINLLSEGYNVMNLYCPLISNRIGGTIFLVIIELKCIILLNNSSSFKDSETNYIHFIYFQRYFSNVINTGLDFTFKYDWIEDQQPLMAENSTLN